MNIFFIVCGAILAESTARDSFLHPGLGFDQKLVNSISNTADFKNASEQYMAYDHILRTVLDLSPELVNENYDALSHTADFKNALEDEYFVFLQKFPLMGEMKYFYHTEVLVCPRSEFSLTVQNDLEEKISSLINFAEIDESYWLSISADCVEMGYGGSFCERECCSVGKRNMPLNARQAVITNADVTKKSLFIYGKSKFDGETAYHSACDHKCWSRWSGLNYDPITNNCNTFTSTILSCVYGLSQKKPDLGLSDLISVECDCTPDFEGVQNSLSLLRKKK